MVAVANTTTKQPLLNQKAMPTRMAFSFEGVVRA
jgi:hypothetical protein